jgi:hypothetical protein
MSTYYSYSNYEQERKRKEEERARAPKKCPHCGDPINQNLSQWDRIRYHCGKDKCRKAASRTNIADRKRQEKDDARARILQWCEAWLDPEQHHTIMEMTDTLIKYGKQRLALRVVKVLDDKKCKHDRIQVLIDNADAAKRRAEKAEEYNRELTALYERRIEELEAELHVYQLLENAVHNIGTRQLEKQPDQEPNTTPLAPGMDEDRAQVLATLRQAGIKPIEEALAAEQDDQEGAPENYEEDEDYDEGE